MESEKDDWEKFEKDNLAITLNVFCAKNEKIYPAYVSKHNSKHKKHVNLLMIPSREGCHYIAVKQLPALLRGITSKHNRCEYCFNCLH